MTSTSEKQTSRSPSSLAGKTVLVTGGTGSFGNFIVHRLLSEGVKEVRVFSRDEKKQYDMNVFYAGKKELTFTIGDVRDAESVREAMRGAQVVFHASALKHVSKCETHPSEAIRTNVIGAENVVK